MTSDAQAETIKEPKKSGETQNEDLVGASEEFPTRASMLLYFLKGSKRYFACAILFSLLTSLFDLINPKIVGNAIDVLSGSLSAETVDFSLVKEEIAKYAALVIGIALCGALFRYLFKLTDSIGAEHLVERMRDTLFHHIQMLKYSWYTENPTGDIIQRCTSDVETVKTFLSEQLTSVFRITLMVIIALYFMFSMNVKLAAAAALYIPMIVLYSVLFHNKIGRTFLSADEEEGVLSTIAQENLTGVRVVRAFGREVFERRRFEKQNDKYTGIWMKLMVIISEFWTFGDLFSGFQVLTVLAYGAYLAVKGEITPGEYVAFISYNSMIGWPIRMLGRVISEMSKTGVSIDRIRYIMNSPEEKDLPGAVEPPMDRDIVFDHVSFRYTPESPEVLKDVSFTVKAGTTFGILGGTGSGKSTLIYLLTRLYDLEPGCGSIKIGGVDIKNIKGEWLRRNIGFVLQEPYLFSRSIKENIGMAREDADADEIRRAAEIASLSGTIDKFAEGYDTMIGERGVTLSGGQKQRTAIAQAVIRRAPIMVFDDSLSAVDTETDADIRHALKEKLGDSTVIMISHRITTLMHSDRILVLDRGKAAEMGTHEELIAQGGIYSRICEIQSAGLEEGGALK
ncbi:MAG: ABC transporter ATP-binding protein [Eubacterium sp.]|jgi:ATP-binding cassette subfamily B protein